MQGPHGLDISQNVDRFWGDVSNFYIGLQTSNPMFQSLINEKRSGDATAAARRQSFSDQKPNMGFLGQMWYK